MIVIIKDKNQLKRQDFIIFLIARLNQMDMQDAQMDYEEEEYQSTSLSSQSDLLSELLLASSDQKFLEIVVKIVNQKENLLTAMSSYGKYVQSKKKSTYIRNITERVARLLITLKQNQRYTETQNQKALLKFVYIFYERNASENDEQLLKSLKIISQDLTSFQDFIFIIRETKQFRLALKGALFSSEKLYYLYHEKYEKLEDENTRMKFGQTMKSLDEQKKLIVKVEIMKYYLYDHEHSRWLIEGSEMQKFIDILTQKPYKNLLESILINQSKLIRNLKTLILKSKLQVKDGKSEIVFGQKCQIHHQLKTQQIFELTVKSSNEEELFKQFETDSLLVEGDYMYTKWSQDILILAKDKISLESQSRGLGQRFVKLMSFFKKLFEHRQKHIQFLGQNSKMIQQNKQKKSPKETTEYICHFLQLVVKFLSYNTIEINHRQHNLSEIIPTAFLQELLNFFEKELQNSLQAEENSTEQKNEKQKENILVETTDYLVSLLAHLFYRRDFQSIAGFTSKISTNLLKILLIVPRFPYRWAVLRNYKLVIDRWSESVPEGSLDYTTVAKKFLESYFNQKVIVSSKSSSTVFNPIFLTKAYCQIFGVELLKFIQIFEKQLDEIEAKSGANNVSRLMNSKISKVILFLSTRVRYSQSNKIAQVLTNIYRKYAHVVPQIYTFRSWITQLNLAKCNQAQLTQKLSECSKLLSQVSQKTQKLEAKQLMTPINSLNQQDFSETLKILNLYKTSHSKIMNSLEIKPKSQQLRQQILRGLVENASQHIEVFYGIYKKTKDFQIVQKETYDLLREQNQLNSRFGVSTILKTIQDTKKNILALVRYFVCNAQKILTTKDYSHLIGLIGIWVRNFVTQSQKNKDQDKISFYLKNLNILIGCKLPLAFDCHLMKNQILGAARAIHGSEQLGLKKNDSIPFNEVVGFYEQIKPVYYQFIRLLIETKTNENSKSKNQNQLADACTQILEYSIFPLTNIVNPCTFNAKIQKKATQNMVLGVFLDQAKILIEFFSINDFLLLNQKYPLATMLKITQDKLSKITEQKVARPNQGGIFAGMRSNRNRAQVRNQLIQYGYTEDQIQIALQNIQIPDAELASQWIQNNQQRIYNLLVEKAIKQSQQETMMKKQQPKLQKGQFNAINYSQFKDKLKQAMDNLVRSLWKNLFDQDIEKGKKMTDLVFVLIDAFKDKYKTNQYLNFSNRMFKEIQTMKSQVSKPNYKFDDKKYRLILYIINCTLKKEPQVFKNYFKDKQGICLKVLQFIRFFGQGFQNQVQKQKQKSQNFSQLLQIVNKTLPQWKSPLQEVKPELIDYLKCLLDLINVSSLGNKDVWQILYKISSLQLPSLKDKIINIFSNIVLSKHILQDQREKLKEENRLSEKQKRNIFYKAPRKSLPSRAFMLPLVKILLEQDKQLLVSNIELQIKRYIYQQYKNDYNQNNKLQQGKKKPLQIDLRRFSSSFEKFHGCAEFEKVFKKLFTKKKNMKHIIIFDYAKHPLFMSELFNQQNKQSFISLKFSSQVEQVLQTLISRVLQFRENQRELQQESLISLYKFLDHFKVLIPTVLRTQFTNPQTNQLTTFLEWLLCDSAALNEKKFHLMVFLAMKNHLYANEKQSISDWVCNQYMTIFNKEIDNFSVYLKEKKNNEMDENQNVFKQESVQQIKFKKMMFNFMYLLQVDKFNSQCFLKTQGQYSTRDKIETLFIQIKPQQLPILYSLLSEIIFILRKREMIELLKDKYELHCPQVKTEQHQTVNLNRSQFLNMSLIYKVEPTMIGQGAKTLKSSSRRRNIFSGSSGRIIVDEVQDEQGFDQEMNLDQMEAHGEYYDEEELLGFRMRQRERSNLRSQNNGESFLYPNQTFRLANQQAPVQVNNQSLEEKPQKIQQQMEQQKQENQKQLISQFDYAQNLRQQSQQLRQTLQIVSSLLPPLKLLTVKSKSQVKIKELNESKMISQEDSYINSAQDIENFTRSLQLIQEKVNQKTSLIIAPNTRFDPSSDINPEFFSKLSLKENTPKLIKFDKRFKSLIMALIPQIKLNVWENDHGSSSYKISSSEMVREIPNARWLLARLQRQDNIQNRDRVLNSIENMFNLGRENRRQQETRPRVINLNQAIQSLPEQQQPPKEQEKPKSKEKQQKSSQKVEIKPENIQMKQNQVMEQPKQEKIVQQKPQQSIQGKIQEQKVVEPSSQIEQNSIKMVIQQQKPELSEQIMVEEPRNQQTVVNIEPQPQIMQETGPYRQILAMFNLPQTFLADNGMDPEAFDSLPQQLQIDQITHYMSQSQNRMAINQLNQANNPVQTNAQRIPGQNENAQQNQGGTAVNDVLQQNIALFASMDPETRMQMLADYPPQFLMQLPVQMRTQVQQYRQRQLLRFASQQEGQNRFGLREALINPQKKKEKNLKDLEKENIKYPSPTELNFNPVSDSLAEHLTKSIFLKVEKTPMINGFRFLLQNYLTQQKALATIIAILNIDDGIKSIQLEKRNEQEQKKIPQNSQKQILISKKQNWKCQTLLLTDSRQINTIKQTLLNLVLQTLNSSVYKNSQFLMKKVSFKNYLNLSVQPQKDLQADQDGFWPLYELLSLSLTECPKLSVQILKKVKELPLKLIKDIVSAIRQNKLSLQIYKNLEFLSKNQNMKKLFMQEFPEQRPLKLQIFAKVIKYEFARVPYLKKLHEEALNYYSADYNEFLNQIFGIYSLQDMKEIESILIKHKKVHFQVIKYLYSQNRVLDKEPMGVILKMPHLLDFETKKYLFRKHPKIRRTSRYRLPIQVSRDNILQQSFNQIMSKTPKELEGRPQVTFIDEPGHDAGGLTRQWLLSLSKQIFNPNYALFEPSSSGNTYQPNPKSYVNPDHLQYFKFIGRFVGKALAQNELVDAYFTRAFYKMVLGQQIELADLEQQDFSFYKSMLWLKQNPIQEGDYTFSYLYDNFGQRIVKDLIPGGRDINVNEQNKRQYIEKYCLAKLRDDFKVQIEKFLQGFHEIIPHECISFFEAKQLELLISGLPSINFEDLKNNVDYSGYAPNDQAIKWFWQILEEFTQQDLARLIQFITGTSKIPVDGFANIKGMNGPQRISIHKDPNSHQLPKAHTCFNQLDLPNYDTKQIMRERIVTAITWGSEGFGFM